MSFSSKVKEELINVIPKARHCQIAEAAAIVYIEGIVKLKDNGNTGAELKVFTENKTVIKKFNTLLSHLLKKYNQELTRDINSCSVLLQNDEAEKVISMLKIDSGHMSEDVHGRIGRISSRILTNTCCKRAFLRGIFLCSGSLTNPEKKYHFELALPDMEKAEQMKELIGAFGIEAKIVPRKKQFVLYVKEAERISDILNIMGAHVSLMDLENIRILKDFRNNINRQVNCETANLNKTVTASSKKIEDIIYIRDKVGLSSLDDGLSEIAMLRIEHPEASLKELGEMLSEPIGKSGVNHRLRRLSRIAQNLRDGN